MLQFGREARHRRWHPAVNIGADDLPLGGVAEVSGMDSENRFQVRTPTEDGPPGKIVVVGDLVPVDGYGSVTFDYPTVARVPLATVARDRLAVMAGQTTLQAVDGATVQNYHAWFAAWGDASAGIGGHHYTMVQPGVRNGDLITQCCPACKWPDTLQFAYAGTPPAFLHGTLTLTYASGLWSYTLGSNLAVTLRCRNVGTIVAIYRWVLAYSSISGASTTVLTGIGKEASSVQCAPPLLTFDITPADCGASTVPITGTFTITP